MDQKNAPLILVIVISFGFFGLMLVLAFHSVPTENKDALVAMLGVLGTAFGSLVGYYFGASVGKPPAPQIPAEQAVIPAAHPVIQEGQ